MSTNSRRSSLALAVMVLLIGAGWAYWRSTCCGPAATTEKDFQAAGILAEFHTTCLKEARKANGGGELAMDAATEEKLVGYCDCVAEALPAHISPTELEKLGLGEQSDATTEAIGVVVSACQAKHLQ